MSTEKVVFNKLFKTQKNIELSLQDELEDLIQDMLSRFSEYETIVEDRLETGVRYESLKTEEYLLAQGLLDDRVIAQQKIDEFYQKADELGFTPDLSKYEGGLKNLENGIKFASSGIVDLNF